MPVEPWPTVTVGGKDYWDIDAKLRVAKESDPNAQVLILIATPNGGIANLGPLVQGDPGQHAEIEEAVNFTPLEPDDPTPDSFAFTTITPPSASTPGVWRAVVALHKGAKGDPGDTVLDPADYSATTPGQVLAVNSGLTDFELVTPKAGDFYWPATINNTPSGNPSYTLGVCSIGSKPYDRRVIPFGYTIITGTGPDVAVDLIARLNGETGGNIVGRCPGIAGATDRLIMAPGVPTAAADTYNKILASNSATVHFRVERQTGADTYTTSNSTTRFGVLAVAI